MPLRCVPLNLHWTGEATKLDLKAMYRKGEVITALPMRRHDDWLRKGFVYLTLADADSLEKVAPSLRAAGLDPRDYQQGPQRSPWNAQLYMEGLILQEAEYLQELRELVARYGVEVVEAIKQKDDPAFRVPESLRGEAKKAKVPA